MTTPKYESKVICCHKRSFLFTRVLDLGALITRLQCALSFSVTNLQNYTWNSNFAAAFL
jgi:hypothetical protein